MEAKKKIVIIGTSDHGKYAIDIIQTRNEFIIIGFLDQKYKEMDSFEGYPILGDAFHIQQIIAENNDLYGFLVAIGDNYNRAKVYDIITKQTDLVPITAIHSSAIISKSAQIGNGTLIMAGVIVNNHCTIGNNVFLATKTSVDHDSIIHDHSSLSPGVTTGGRVIIGEMCAIGLGVNIIHYKTIGDYSVIGSGSTVVKDIDSGIVAYGTPAKEIRKRDKSDKYL